MMKQLGQQITEEELEDFVCASDVDGNCLMSFVEFIHLMSLRVRAQESEQ